MKKVNYFIIALTGAFVISCGGKKSENTTANGNEIAEEVTQKDCDCSELPADAFKDVKKNGSSELFSGRCVTKDQNDSIIKIKEFKNGWLTRIVERQELEKAKKYASISDFEYKNGEAKNGYRLSIENQEIEGGKNYYYVDLFTEKKDGNDFNHYSVNYFTYDNLYLSYTLFIKDGKSLGINMRDGWNGREKYSSKCFSDDDFDLGDGGFKIKDASPTLIKEKFDCLKNELPHFDYWEY